MCNQKKKKVEIYWMKRLISNWNYNILSIFILIVRWADVIVLNIYMSIFIYTITLLLLNALHIGFFFLIEVKGFLLKRENYVTYKEWLVSLSLTYFPSMSVFFVSCLTVV